MPNPAPAPAPPEANNNTGASAGSSTPMEQPLASQTTPPSLASQTDSGVASALPDLSTTGTSVSQSQPSSEKCTTQEGDTVPSQKADSEPEPANRLFRGFGAPARPSVVADCVQMNSMKAGAKGAKRARGRPRASNATTTLRAKSSRSRKSAPGGGGYNGGLAYRHTPDDESNLSFTSCTSCTSVDSGCSCSGCSTCTNYQLEVLQERPDLEPDSLHKLAAATSAALVLDSTRSSSSFSTPAVPALKEAFAHPVMFSAPPAMRRAASSLAPASAFYSPQVVLPTFSGRNFLSGVIIDPNTGCPLY